MVKKVNIMIPSGVPQHAVIVAYYLYPCTVSLTRLFSEHIYLCSHKLVSYASDAFIEPSLCYCVLRFSFCYLH